MRITSTDNPRIKAFAKLKKARERRRTGLFLIEGYREVERAQRASVEIEVTIVCPDLLGPSGVETGNSEVLEVTEGPLRRIAMRENPPGVIAVARQFDTTLTRIELPADPLVLIVDHVEKPGNLGAMLRTCDAAGVDVMVVADAATDVFNPNVVRASQGALFSVPIATASTRDVIEWSRDMTVIGGYPAATTSLWDAEMRGPTAVLVGAEDVGISPEWGTVAIPVAIPMAGTSDSLNASVSAAVMLFEAVRQRRPESPR